MLDLNQIFDDVADSLSSSIDEDLSGAESARFRRMLKKNVVKFKYKKKSTGETRKAKGTLR